ncbi:MAG: DUF2283 domain-containing protein [Candidatus Bipolaricaulia bacterium]
MKLTYDPRCDIAYIHLKEKPAEVETIRVSDALNINLAPDGTIYGIELLNANEQLQGVDAGKLLIINEATGTQVEVTLDSA